MEALEDAITFESTNPTTKGDVQKISSFHNTYLSLSLSTLYITDIINNGATMTYKNYSDSYSTFATDAYNPKLIFNSVGIGIILEKYFKLFKN